MTDFTPSDLEAAKAAIRRGVPIGEYLPCTCTAAPPGSRDPRDCFGVCLDAAESVARAIAKARRIGMEEVSRTWFTKDGAKG